MRSSSLRCICVPLLALLACATSCQATASDPLAPIGEPEPFVPLPDEEPHSIGFFLTRFDRSLQQWSELKVASSTSREVHALLALEANMGKRARERRDELLVVLESGAPANRRIAAAALGFSGDPTVLGALLASLSEADPELVRRALMSIGVLANPETPVAEIRFLLEHDKDDMTRNNAAFAMHALAGAGNHSPELAAGCRVGLGDSEAAVRAQCASALGILGDVEAMALLEGLLFDSDDLVALASAAALANIGRLHMKQKGPVARALAGSLSQVRSDRRVHFLGALRWLSEQDRGEDAEPWLDWAHRLP